ncbi:hypothetical protein BDV26DRAFT_305170 [Aspergillus bertholletiae]|uniref:Arrestin-like N-terminal domain-containing protein n=1 Tax=Aspergillus bertholletiae TaxID=1226010 RepID=A0A5N7B4J6_9EURO|nr:hypothetical protein BDV26DRAFT_305170 [Aspergillus bertholletiae]
MAFKRPCAKVQISLADGTKSYTPGNKIEGTVCFTPRSKITIHQLRLSLEGKTVVRVDTNDTNIPLPQTTASKTFLQMDQPLYDMSCQKVGMLQIGTEYRLPFEFVVPAELLPHVCQRHHRHEQLQWEHLQLPPSFGKRSQAYDEQTEDMTAGAIAIQYHVRFSIMKKSQKDGRVTIVGDWTQLVHIRSPRLERPPVLIPENSTFYCLSQEAYIIKGLCRRRLGLLSAQTSAQLSVDQRDLSAVRPIRINLKYNTTAGSPLPTISCIQAELSALTSFGLTPWSDFPDLTEPATWDRYNECHEHNVPLKIAGPAFLHWRRANPGARGNTHQAFPVADTGYTTTLEAPITFPSRLPSTPTFYSCLVARTYSLRMSLRFEVEEQQSRTSTISLTVPLQIYGSLGQK